MIADARRPATPWLPRSCRHEDGTPKAVYRTERDALSVRRQYGLRKELGAYYCDRHPGWHLGHKA